MEKYDSIPSLGEQQTSSRVFTCLVVFAEVTNQMNKSFVFNLGK